MKKVVLVTGSRTSLKTTVCQKLETDLGIMVYNFDDLKKIIIGLDTERQLEKSKYYNLVTLNLISKLIKDTLAVHEYVILDMGYTETRYVHLTKLCKTEDFDLITLFMTGDPDVLYDRYVKRVKYEVQRGEESDIMDLLDFKDTMMSISDKFDHTCIQTIDTTSFDDQDYTILMHQIIDQLEWKLNDPIR